METRKEILTEDTVNCIDELMVEENHVNAVYEIWIPADEYFGIDLDEWGDTTVDFYTNWYPKDNHLEAYYILRNDAVEKKVEWTLNAYEESLLLWKMEKHCQEMYQKTLLSIFIEGVLLSEKSPLNVRKQLLEEDLVNCLDGLLVEMDHVRASYEILIPADEYFGIDFDKYSDNAVVDVYTDWYPKDNHIEAYYIVRDKNMEKKVMWGLNAYEVALLTWKMQKHSQELYQKDLKNVFVYGTKQKEIHHILICIHNPFFRDTQVLSGKFDDDEDISNLAWNDYTGGKLLVYQENSPLGIFKEEAERHVEEYLKKYWSGYDRKIFDVSYL